MGGGSGGDHEGENLLVVRVGNSNGQSMHHVELLTRCLGRAGLFELELACESWPGLASLAQMA